MLNKTVSILATTLFLGAAFAADDSLANRRAATSTTAAPAATHTVSVGADGFNFIPSSINASVGDIIEYRFYPQNHSVARAAYGQPCIPYEYTAAGRVGFWSGFVPLQLVASDPPKFQIKINDTQPLFFYCSAPGACFEGMVGVVNPNATQTFQNQFEFSQNATQEFSPGENVFPVETAPVRTTTATGVPTTSTSGPTSATSSPATTTTAAAATTSHHSGLSAGAIAGIAIGGFVGLLLFIALIYMCGRQKTMSEILHRHSQAPTQTTYRPASTGVSEAQYPNMVKNPNSLSLMSNPYGSHAYTETDGSYRSASPPIDERTGMNPTAWGPSGQALSGQGSPNSNTGAFPSPQYYNDGLHTHEHSDLKPIPTPYAAPSLHHDHQDHEPASGPHELPAPGRHPSNVSAPSDLNSPRPFSYTDSESGYAMRDTRIDDIARR